MIATSKLTLALAWLTVVLATGCAPGAELGSDELADTEVQASGLLIPAEVELYLERNHWGEHHVRWHGTRQWFIAGDKNRRWLDSIGEKHAAVQEGDVGSGIEFLAMHTAMIEALRRFDELPVNDEFGNRTFADVLDGWETDEDVLAAIDTHAPLEHREEFRSMFEEGIDAVNDFARFETEDAWGNFVQTRLRLTGEVDPWDSFERFYKRDGSRGAGLHNTLHGIFSDPESSIDVLDSEVNLKNKLFWGIHGWLDQKWREFQAGHERTPEEQAAFDHQMDRFRLHMHLMSDEAAGDHEHADPVPLDVAAELTLIIHANRIHCEHLDETTAAEGCERVTPKSKPGDAERGGPRE